MSHVSGIAHEVTFADKSAPLADRRDPRQGDALSGAVQQPRRPDSHRFRGDRRRPERRSSRRLAGCRRLALPHRPHADARRNRAEPRPQHRLAARRRLDRAVSGRRLLVPAPHFLAHALARMEEAKARRADRPCRRGGHAARHQRTLRDDGDRHIARQRVHDRHRMGCLLQARGARGGRGIRRPTSASAPRRRGRPARARTSCCAPSPRASPACSIRASMAITPSSTSMSPPCCARAGATQGGLGYVLRLHGLSRHHRCAMGVAATGSRRTRLGAPQPPPRCLLPRRRAGATRGLADDGARRGVPSVAAGEAGADAAVPVLATESPAATSLFRDASNRRLARESAPNRWHAPFARRDPG